MNNCRQPVLPIEMQLKGDNCGSVVDEEGLFLMLIHLRILVKLKEYYDKRRANPEVITISVQTEPAKS